MQFILYVSKQGAKCKKLNTDTGIFTATNIEIMLFRVMTPRSSVGGYRRLGAAAPILHREKGRTMLKRKYSPRSGHGIYRFSLPRHTHSE
jgi:hypothetical protein